jgi:hypothetical protein
VVSRLLVGVLGLASGLAAMVFAFWLYIYPACGPDQLPCDLLGRTPSEWIPELFVGGLAVYASVVVWWTRAGWR